MQTHGCLNSCIIQLLFAPFKDGMNLVDLALVAPKHHEIVFRRVLVLRNAVQTNENISNGGFGDPKRASHEKLLIIFVFTKVRVTDEHIDRNEVALATLGADKLVADCKGELESAANRHSRDSSTYLYYDLHQRPRE